MTGSGEKLMHRLFDYVEKLILATVALATIYAGGQEVLHLLMTQSVQLADLLLLFIYAEVIGMVAVFYREHAIPIQLPMFIAITALSRLIILQGKDIAPEVLIFEGGAILLLSISIAIITYAKHWEKKEAGDNSITGASSDKITK